MNRRAARTFLLWLLAMLAGALIVWHSRFTADMSFFLPARPSVEQKVLIDQLKEGMVSRLLMLAIEGGNATERAEASRALRERLEKSGHFVSIQNGQAGSHDADREYLLHNRYLLSPAVTPERFTIPGLRAAIDDSIELLASPAGMMLKTLLPRDPTGELWAQLEQLDAGAEPLKRDGVWASRDGERAMLLLQTRALGSDTDGQQQAIEMIHAEFAAIAPNLKLQLSGPGLFAVKARATIQHEVSRLSTLSTVAIVLVLLFVYRSPRLVGLGLLPVVSGALAGIVAVSLGFGTVFGITVGFGSALIGEAVDYSIYYFLQSGREGIAGWRSRFWPTVRLGVLTSVAGFGTLLFSGFPGLAQLGLYSLAGVATAALVTRFVLPAIAGNVAPTRDLGGLGRSLAAAVHRARRLRLPVLLLATLAAAYLFQQRAVLWTADLSVLSTVSAADAARDQSLRSDISAPDARYMVVVTAADREQVLQAAERAGQKLDRLVAEGVIGGYDSPARFLPSQATQQARRGALPDGGTLRAHLAEALVGAPLAASRLTPFIDDIEATRQGPLLDRQALQGTSLALLVDSLLLASDGRWSVLLPLKPPVDAAEPTIASASVRTALAGSEALFIDMKAEFDHLYSDYLQEALLLSLGGFAAICLLLGVTLRSPRRLGAVLLPLVIAVILVIAGLHALGERLHLLHLIGMLLIVAVGSNYALFFDRKTADGPPEAATLASMAVANLTTAIGFGTLGLSSVPVLHAVGVTVGPGAVLALALAAIFVPHGTSESGA